MARAGSGVADGPFDVIGDGPRAQPLTASVVVSTTVSETTETAARILSVIIVSSIRDPARSAPFLIARKRRPNPLTVRGVRSLGRFLNFSADTADSYSLRSSTERRC